METQPAKRRSREARQTPNTLIHAKSIEEYLNSSARASGQWAIGDRLALAAAANQRRPGAHVDPRTSRESVMSRARDARSRFFLRASGIMRFPKTRQGASHARHRSLRGSASPFRQRETSVCVQDGGARSAQRRRARQEAAARASDAAARSVKRAAAGTACVLATATTTRAEPSRASERASDRCGAAWRGTARRSAVQRGAEWCGVVRSGAGQCALPSLSRVERYRSEPSRAVAEASREGCGGPRSGRRLARSLGQRWLVRQVVERAGTQAGR